MAFFRDGIEYLDVDFPTTLSKLMVREYADQLVSEGKIRFCSYRHYIDWDNLLLGDKNEGTGIYILNENPLTLGSINNVYVWSTFSNKASDNHLREIANCSGYSSRVTIKDPYKFAQKLSQATSRVARESFLQCGLVRYDKGSRIETGSRPELVFNSNIFQKDSKFSPDHEFRFAIVDCSSSSSNEDFLTLQLRDFSDLIDSHDFT